MNTLLTRFLTHSCGLGAILFVANGLAQTPAVALPHGFEYTRHDAAAPQLPDDYPAKRYTAEQLLKRFVEMAEGPELSREEIEQEFGLRFVKLFEQGHYLGVARGRYPLGNELSRYTDYRDGKGTDGVFITFELRGRIVSANGEFLRWTKPKICVQNEQLFQTLGPNWTRITRQHPFRAFYMKSSEGRVRKVETSPTYSIGYGECIHSFHLIYDVDPTPHLRPRP